MTTIYGVWDGIETFYYPTKAAAMRAAREVEGDDVMGIADEVEVTAYVVSNLPKRELFCALANGRHWVAESSIVARVAPKPPAPQPDPYANKERCIIPPEERHDAR